MREPRRDNSETLKTYYLNNSECDPCGWITDLKKTNGLYCHRCGSKTYLSTDGSHRRCPNCDDYNYLDGFNYQKDYGNNFVITCESK